MYKGRTMDKRKPLPMNPDLKEYAVKMRKNQTPEEKKVWFQILKGHVPKFHRQRIIGNYIVDFFCASAKLVIELDGTQHYEEKGLEKDTVRDEFLKNCGYTVKRYFNRDMHLNFEGVCRDIYITIYGHDWD